MTENVMQFQFLWDVCYDPGLQLPQVVNLGDPQVKTSLKTLEVFQEYLRGWFRPSGWPDRDVDLYHLEEEFGHHKKPSPFLFNTKTWEEKSSLQPLGISLLK